MIHRVVTFAVTLLAMPNTALSAGTHDGAHDFDFEFGRWSAHIERLDHPLSGSTTWNVYTGTSVVRKIWNGRGNIGELEVTGPKGHIEGLTVRLYNPQTRLWNVSWASSNDGILGQPPTVGSFANGRGEFFDRESLKGRPILVRFIISNITPDAFQFEQAFSPDNGKTWETNWKSTFTRMR